MSSDSFVADLFSLSSHERFLYYCSPFSAYGGNTRLSLENCGKIILSPQILEALSKRNIEFPLIFKIFNPKNGHSTHAGVLEFTAENDYCHMPNWILRLLTLDANDLVLIERVSLPIATFSKFQPVSMEFLDITNPKAVLENSLRNFACLTEGDTIAIQYNNKEYELKVLATMPERAVNIIECDMNVEFEAPMDYIEPPKQFPEPKVDSLEANDGFGSNGLRLDGKPKRQNLNEDGASVSTINPRYSRIILPDYDYKTGSITFDRSVLPISDRMPLDNQVNQSNDTANDNDGVQILSANEEGGFDGEGHKMEK